MELVSVTDAGRALGVHPSQVSRGLKKGLFANHGTPTRPLVNIEEARRARSRGLDQAMQRGPQAPLFQASPVDDGDDGDDGVPSNPSFQSARTRRELAAATKAELELARLRAETLDRREVADAAFAIGQIFREALDARRAQLAAKLEGLEPNAMLVTLEEADRAALGLLADLVEQRFSEAVVAA